MTTKERIIDESLTLFSIRGFSGTSVKNIADAVGIKDSSLYKHFSSKQEILDTIINEMHIRMENMSSELFMPMTNDMDEVVAAYEKMTGDDLIKLTHNVFLFYLTDAFMSRFWRMANIEQYHNTTIYDIFRNLFMEESISYQTELFSILMKHGILKEANPRVLAISFFSPIFFLLSKYNGHEDEITEAINILHDQVQEFLRIYGI